MALADASVLDQLLHLYDFESDERLRGMLRSLLSSIPKPEVQTFALRLASNANTALHGSRSDRGPAGGRR